jgi:hypothetical protein
MGKLIKTDDPQGVIGLYWFLKAYACMYYASGSRLTGIHNTNFIVFIVFIRFE